MQVAKRAGLVPSVATGGYAAFFKEMKEKGLIAIEEKSNYSYCTLSEVGRKLVYPNVTEIVKGEDGRLMAEAEIKAHQSKLRFIFPAIQTKDGKMIKAPAFLVFDYTTQEAFAVETESGKRSKRMANR